MDFNFSAQHHAIIHSENATTVILSLFDNAAENEGRQSPTDSVSSAKMVALHLDTEPKTAKVCNVPVASLLIHSLNYSQLLQVWYRPDGQVTPARGSASVLPNGNMLIGWSTEGYMSEHTATGDLVLEARFSAANYATYRALKFNLTSNPIESPVIESFVTQVHGGTGARSTTAMYASWNGATEVASWKFYGSHSANSGFLLLDQVNKTGFETSLVYDGAWTYTYAEAISLTGAVLRRTATKSTGAAAAQSSDHLDTTGPRAGSRRRQQVDHMSVVIVASMSLGVLLALLYKKVLRCVHLPLIIERCMGDSENQVRLLSDTDSIKGQ